MKRSNIALLVLAAVGSSICGCGDSASTPVADQSKMSPEDVQKEIQKLSPPSTKGKAKTK